MWLINIVLAVLIPCSFGYEAFSLELTTMYFKYRAVHSVCLLTCEDNLWVHKFVKQATIDNMAVSYVKINNNFSDFAKINKCINQKFGTVGVLIDAKCSKFEEVMEIGSLNMQFDAMHKWFILEDGIQTSDYYNNTILHYNRNNDFKINVSKTEATLDNLNISVDTDIVIGINNDDKGIVASGDSFTLYDTYNFGKIQGGKLIYEEVATWNDDTGYIFNFDLNAYKYYRRWNFRQITLRMVLVVTGTPESFDPEWVIGRVVGPGVAVITQTSATLEQIIAEIHNFRYSFTVSDRWIGNYTRVDSKIVATSLYYRTQDITPVLRYLPDSTNKYDVLHPPVTSIETRYYYRIPTYGAGKYENQFLRPLTTGAWICVLGVVSFCAVILLLSAKLENRPMPTQYAIFSVIASFCQQFFEDCGETVARKKLTGRRITVLVTGLCCVLIYNYYTSSVVSWLLNGPPPSINSLEELLQSPLELIYEDIGYTRSWLQTPGYYFNKRNAKIEDEIQQKKVLNKNPNSPLFKPVEVGIEMVKAGGYAYHTEVNTANMLISRKFTQKELCELGSLSSMEKTPLYAAVQKRSPFKEFLAWSMSRLAERGIISCIQRRTGTEAISCEGSSPRPLALGGAAPAFLLLAFGYLLATVIMLLERLHYKLYIRPQRIETTAK